MKLFSVLAHAGVKGAAAQAARDDLFSAVQAVLLHGNRRNIMDTCDALRLEGATTKVGNYAANTKGDVLRALVALDHAAQAAQPMVRPVLKGKPTAQECVRALEVAIPIIEAYGQVIQADAEARELVRKASKASKASKATTEATATATAEATTEAEATATAPKADSDDPVKLRAMVTSLVTERDELKNRVTEVTLEGMDTLAEVHRDLFALQASFDAVVKHRNELAEALAAVTTDLAAVTAERDALLAVPARTAKPRKARQTVAA